VTALNSPIPISPRPQQRGNRVDDFIDRLSHPAPVQSTGAFIALFQCLISFGLLPLLLWPARWAEFLDAERPDLQDLIAWWRRRAPPANAAQLDKFSRRLRPRPFLMVLPWLAVGFNVVLMAILYTQNDQPNRLWELTFQHAHAQDKLVWDTDHWSPTVPLEKQLYSAWIVTLCLAYFCQWYAVRSHAVTVHAIAQWTNEIGRDNQFVRVSNDVLKIGLNPLWIIFAIALCGNHAWWAIPMVFAGAMQRRYTMQSSPAIRVALANQARDSFTIVQSGGDRFCSASHCGARLPTPARFCPRCGTAA
jgi:hypothetical protein